MSWSSGPVDGGDSHGQGSGASWESTWWERNSIISLSLIHPEPSVPSMRVCLRPCGQRPERPAHAEQTCSPEPLQQHRSIEFSVKSYLLPSNPITHHWKAHSSCENRSEVNPCILLLIPWCPCLSAVSRSLAVCLHYSVAVDALRRTSAWQLQLQPPASRWRQRPRPLTCCGLASITHWSM